MNLHDFYMSMEDVTDSGFKIIPRELYYSQTGPFQAIDIQVVLGIVQDNLTNNLDIALDISDTEDSELEELVRNIYATTGLDKLMKHIRFTYVDFEYGSVEYFGALNAIMTGIGWLNIWSEPSAPERGRADRPA
jgi:hypothetical protein